jgi:hypothetical protein
MKAIFLPLALAALAVDARASHRDGFFMSFGKFGFGFSARVHYAPVAPVYFAPVGHYEYRERQVYVPGCFETVWIDPVFENRRYHYRTIRLCVRAGYYQRVWRDPYYRTEKYRVWVPGPVVCR